MKSFLLHVALLSLLAVGAYYVSQSGDLSAAQNTTTFFQKNSCVNKLPYFQCDQITDDTELSLCYQASYGVSRLTYNDGDLLTPVCEKYLTYLAGAIAQDLVNQNNFYEDCYLSKEVLTQAQKSKVFYNQNYVPRFITCSGF